jgi:inorganic phosphate transporter, PiT family
MMLYLLIGLALIFDFLNGFHDASNIVATVISSRAMHPRTALYLTAAAEFIAPFIFGVAVAAAVGRGLIDPQAVQPEVVIAAVLAAVLWNLATWYLGIPSSSSHALVGGLLGSAILARGFGVVQGEGLVLILAALLFSPVLGFLVGYLVMKVVRQLVQGATPRVNLLFKRMQIFTAIGLALSHGSNDAQKTMGIITLGLVSAGVQETFFVPFWVIAISAGAIALGTAAGGWRLIRTLGGRIYKIRPVDAFSSQAASASVILAAALLGGPVSTTHVVSSSIMGVGAADRISKVRWQVAYDFLLTWLLTIPSTALLSALLYLPIHLLAG